MDCNAQYLSYAATGFFSKIVIDYLEGKEELKPFYTQPVSLNGIRSAIEARKGYPYDRKLLVDILETQYADTTLSAQQQLNIKRLSDSNCFTITTAHQPNIFSGHLYFVYKILHAIKIAEELTTAFPENNFVPVFYMGSEDADLDELGHVYLSGEKYKWQTTQTGAVGRMKVDKALVKLINDISGQLGIYPHGEEIIALMKECYREGTTIEQAAFKLINKFFAEYGLVVLLPDNAKLKRAFIPVIEKELNEAFSHQLVTQTVDMFPPSYKAQAGGRELNLFYLLDESRDRIEKEHSKFRIQHSKLEFDEITIKEELQQFPERFSPNVILRPVFQEMILPNIVFIGGGGEIAYWLELKKVFEAVNIPFPVMVLRNSFMLVSKEQAALAGKLNLSNSDLFSTETELLNELVKRESVVKLSLDEERQQLTLLYENMKQLSGNVDSTLVKHTDALMNQALKKITVLEKKMLRAEKRKFEAQQRQVHKLKEHLFPHGSLQERIENIMPFYAKWGRGIISMIYEKSAGLEQKFCILEER
jgi:bacillithiol biosynthesis cysteine-adding enzyme BshC